MAGGWGGHELDSTEVMDYGKAGGWGGVWREVGLLPSPRDSLRGATLAGIFHVTGGFGPFIKPEAMDEILAWDSVSETWAVAGQLSQARHRHAVTEVPLDALANFCSTSN